MGSYVDRCEYNPGDVIDGRYQVLKVLGEGSFGKVYHVKRADGLEYALKMLRLWEVPPDIREGLMQRFKMEFQTGQISCEYLVQSIDYGNVGGNPYIVMEYCSGGDLTQYIGRRDIDTSTICEQILLGLKALDKNGKVHRDLKPENVLFKSNGVAALTDFGIAGERNKRMTERNIFGKPYQIFGTYAYMPPEQVNRARGMATVLATTDIWSFGVLLYQLLTGELPFGPLENHNDLVGYQRRGKNGDWSRAQLMNIPDGKAWIRVIEACLVPDYKQRVDSADKVIRLLPRSNILLNNVHGRSSVSVGSKHSAPQLKLTSNVVLHIMQGDEYGKKYPVADMVRKGTHVITIGRSQENVMQIVESHSSYISRYHCTLECADVKDEWILRDGQWLDDVCEWHDSSNGTYIGSTRVSSEGMSLKHGNIITIGDTKLRFEVEN